LDNITKRQFLDKLSARYGRLQRITSSQSLFDAGDNNLRVYVRYSKKHKRNSMFYGLRKIDLQLLEGRPSVLCFLWSNQEEPLLIPFSEFEEVFRSVEPASDGQYKVQVYNPDEMTELYIANAGRFNVESYYGWGSIEVLFDLAVSPVPELSHSQIQTLLGSLGTTKGYEVWIPTSDQSKMDWSLTHPFECARDFPLAIERIRDVGQQIDVIWTARARGTPRAFFEIEHSTPIYSALLRFNDVHILAPRLGAAYSVVSNEARRSLFVRQLGRPTFKASGLAEACNFLEYRNVFLWHKRITSQQLEGKTEACGPNGREEGSAGSSTRI